MKEQRSTAQAMPRADSLRSLRAWARRHTHSDAEADDVLQEALLVTVQRGRWTADGSHAAFTAGVVRHLGQELARSESRRRQREHRHAATQDLVVGGCVAPAEGCALQGAQLLDVARTLPPALGALGLLVLAGHTREEAAWLLDLGDAALRQRLSGLKQRLALHGLRTPEEFPALRGNLPYGRIRRALLHAVVRAPAPSVGLHDPDGHLLMATLPAGARAALLTKRTPAATTGHAVRTPPPSTGADTC